MAGPHSQSFDSAGVCVGGLGIAISSIKFPREGDVVAGEYTLRTRAQSDASRV